MMTRIKKVIIIDLKKINKLQLINLWSILIKTMPIFKTSYFYYFIFINIINAFNKELINSIAI